MHGSETWPMKVEHELKMIRTEMSMIRWMCGVKLGLMLIFIWILVMGIGGKGR